MIDRRLTPDLYSLVVAARQTAGDDFALALAEVAREYPHQPEAAEETPHLRMGLDQADVPGQGVAAMVSRLPGQSLAWRSCELRPKPPEVDRKRWKQRWDPYGMCSWPPEDDRIESFQKHVRDRARAMLGADLARSEKFTASVMDGIDLRETLRNWHTGDLYVKVIPPDRGSIEAVVFLFDTPADPARYPSRATWYAEHAEESTLAFFATDTLADMVGPGIARAEYGGALVPLPAPSHPRHLGRPGARHGQDAGRKAPGRRLPPQPRAPCGAGLSRPPLATWRRLARRSGRKLVYLPIGRFGGQVIERLRTFHILNGKQIRSYAADYIRDS